jgi:Zn-dependent peptidase ImmA (M78 family)
MPNNQEKRILTPSELYAQARQTAKDKRIEFGISTEEISIPVLKKICKKEGIKVDLVKKIGNRIRAAYFNDDDGCSILLKKDLPREPKIFALAHELKHHFLDRKLIESGEIQCGEYNKNKSIEIAAEIFAAEFLYPEDEMRELIVRLGIKAGSCTERNVVEIKKACLVPVSYIFIKKRLVRFGVIGDGEFKDVQFQKLEERLYPPLYKQDWFRRHRERKKLFN